MAEVKEEIKTEDESSHEGDYCYSDPLSPASDFIPKNEMKEEFYDFYESDNSLQIDDFLIKQEKSDISDFEISSNRKESEDENEQLHEIQGSSASASKTLECAASSKFSDNLTLTGHVTSLCRPCCVVLERLDKAKASAAAVFSCPLCKIGFRSSFQRDRHQLQSCRRRRFNKPSTTTLAKKIPATFPLGATLNEPGPESRKRLKCADCSYSTDDIGNFNKHLVTHTGERRFPCTMCEYKATRKASLARHLLTHGDVKPFACTVCNYRAVQKQHLTKHMRLHTGEKPFKCTQCDYACNRSYNFAVHVRTKHTKEHPFSCTQCEYTCVQSSNLARHMLIHGADKKLSCLHCEYKTNYSGNLKMHMLNHGADKKLSCLHCEYKTNRAGDLKKHVAAKHKG